MTLETAPTANASAIVVFTLLRCRVQCVCVHSCFKGVNINSLEPWRHPWFHLAFSIHNSGAGSVGQNTIPRGSRVAGQSVSSGSSGFWAPHSEDPFHNAKIRPQASRARRTSGLEAWFWIGCQLCLRVVFVAWKIRIQTRDACVFVFPALFPALMHAVEQRGRICRPVTSYLVHDPALLQQP